MTTATKVPKKSKKSPAVSPVHDPDGVVPAPYAEISVIHVPLRDIVADDSPNRVDRPNDETVQELAGSMASRGLQHPIGVTTFGVIGESEMMAADSPFRLVWGRRRLEAARLLGWEKIPAVLRRITSEADLIADRATENAHRLQETPVDEALKVAEVLGIFEAQAALGPTAEPAKGEQPNLPVPMAHQVEARKAAVKKAAEYFGMSEQWIRDRGFLSRLGKAEQELVASGRLPLGHAREICKLADPEARKEIAHQAAAGKKKYHTAEYPMPMHELQALVSQQVLSLAQVPWNLAVPFAGRPACAECPHNSANNPGLFEHGVKISSSTAEARLKHGGRAHVEPKSGACTNRACYAVKSGLAKRSLQTTARRLVKEAKELPVKTRPSWDRPASLAKCSTPIPDYLDKSDVAAAAKEASKSKKSGTGGAVEKERYVHRPDPREAAQRQLEKVLQERSKKLEPLIAAVLSKIPGAWAVYAIVKEHHGLIRGTEAHNAKPEKLARLFAGAEFKGLMAHVLNPSIEAFVRIEKGCGRQFDLLDHWYDGKSGLAEATAAELGIDVVDEIGARPTIDDFMPKATKIDPKPAAAAPAGKSKKSKKSAPPPAPAPAPSGGFDCDEE